MTAGIAFIIGAIGGAIGATVALSMCIAIGNDE